MTEHEGKRHWELAQGLIGEHGDVPCYDGMVRCDHERAAVHAALAQAHALAAIAASLEQFVHLFGLYESVPATSPAETNSIQAEEVIELQMCSATYPLDGMPCDGCLGHGGPHAYTLPGENPTMWTNVDQANDGYLVEPEPLP